MPYLTGELVTTCVEFDFVASEKDEQRRLEKIYVDGAAGAKDRAAAHLAGLRAVYEAGEDDQRDRSYYDFDCDCRDY